MSRNNQSNQINPSFNRSHQTFSNVKFTDYPVKHSEDSLLKGDMKHSVNPAKHSEGSLLKGDKTYADWQDQSNTSQHNRIESNRIIHTLSDDQPLQQPDSQSNSDNEEFFAAFDNPEASQAVSRECPPSDCNTTASPI